MSSFSYICRLLNIFFHKPLNFYDRHKQWISITGIIRRHMANRQTCFCVKTLAYYTAISLANAGTQYSCINRLRAQPQIPIYAATLTLKLSRWILLVALLTCTTVQEAYLNACKVKAFEINTDLSSVVSSKDPSISNTAVNLDEGCSPVKTWVNSQRG